MSLRLHLHEQPQRAIAVIGETHALIFRHGTSIPPPQQFGFSVQSVAPRCIVEFSKASDVDLAGYRTLRASGIHGTLGLINVAGDAFLCVISQATRVATVTPRETIQRILSAEFYCINRGDFDDELLEEINPYPTEDVTPTGFEYGHGHEGREGALEHPCLALKKILSSGTFYYSLDFDLTSRMQDRSSEGSSLNDEFLWNSFMIDPIIKFRSRLALHEREALDANRILTSAIRGFALTVTVPASSSPLRSIKTTFPSALTVISRLSCRRAGTRFNARGIDDDGNVANFVETETILWHPSGLCFSYVQVRGSVPVFWEQATGLLPGQQKIQVTRSPEATQPAFDKHFEELQLLYGAVHILNLLNDSKPGEAELTERYAYHTQRSPLNRDQEMGEASEHRLLQTSHFDFHAETKGPGGYEAASMVRRLVQQDAEAFAYHLCDTVDNDSRELSPQNSAVILQQEGVFRTNCLDCLDRTNLIQTIISQMGLECFFNHRSEHAPADFWMRHSNLWADNGDALSKIYAGTGALKSSFTRSGKMSLAGALADARKSATRMYINNFADKGRQNTIDMLLGRLVDQSPVHLYDPINDYINAELKKRVNEFSNTEVVQLWVGTFNLNGKGRGVKEDLSAWLCPELNRLHQSPEIVAVGFQEIVELSPQQIMSTDPARRQDWEYAVGQTLNDHAKKDSSEAYVLLRSGQLVGAALIIYVKSSTLKRIKNVEGSVKKTGMSGIAGNKGAVAIRMDYSNTRLCFVTAHLAAGFANYEERNRDFRTINHGLRFQRNRTIEDHDTVIWLGDFNYRIGLSDERVRRLIQSGDLDTLYQNDQLNLQMVAGRTFPYYSEARITFMPTYKYDNGTDSYDTSEKGRIPAWCDRILNKGDNLRQINYTTAPLRFSDHRPVYATFQCTISIIDESRKDELSQEIYKMRKIEVSDLTKSNRSTSIDDEDLIGYESIAPGLPPASSDRGKWWLENGLSARSNIEVPRESSVRNPLRPSNPFTPSSEPDWVVIVKPSLPQNGHTSRAAAHQDLSGSTRSSYLVVPRLEPGQNIAPASTNNDYLPNRNQVQQMSSEDSAISSSSLSRKLAPPVPKKPSLLSPPIHRQANSGSDAVEVLDQKRSSPPEWKTSATIPSSSKYLPSPRRTSAVTQPSLAARQAPSRGLAQMDHEHIRNPIHPNSRKPLPPEGRSRSASDDSRGLLDDDEDGAQEIPSLQPFRRNR